MTSISVVIPAYNCAHCIGEAVQSVRAQGWPDLQILVVDDGSTDGTAALLRSIQGPDLVAAAQANGGPGAARNTGIREASGEWIAFLDADDLWLPGKLRAQFDAVAAKPDAAFCFTDAVMRDTNGREEIIASPALEGNIFWHLLVGPRFHSGSVVVRRDCLDRVGLFDPSLRTGEDWDMWLRLAAEYESVGVRDVLTVYRQDSSKGTKYSSALLEACTLRVLERLFSRPETQRTAGLSRARRRVYAWHYSVLAKSHIRQRRAAAVPMAARCLVSHARGLTFLMRRWGKLRRYPDFRRG
jgi:glycosyltransferase involved in cell wall biosynthesis